MHIGVFDSGLGGLSILRGLVRRLPGYSYVYLGDTQRVPYGNRSQETIYRFTKEAVEYLFAQGCQLIILACNTASTQALRRLQQEYLPAHYPDRRILGVIIPTVEAAGELGAKRIGVLATNATVQSGAFPREFEKLFPSVNVFQRPAPLLVPLIENGGAKWVPPILESYLRPLLRKKIDTLVLGCTHYPHLKTQIRKIVGKKVRIICQNEHVPKKLEDYLARHPEMRRKLTKRAAVDVCVTEVTPVMRAIAKKWFGRDKVLKLVMLGSDARSEGVDVL